MLGLLTLMLIIFGPSLLFGGSIYTASSDISLYLIFLAGISLLNSSNRNRPLSFDKNIHLRLYYICIPRAWARTTDYRLRLPAARGDIKKIILF